VYVCGINATKKEKKEKKLWNRHGKNSPLGDAPASFGMRLVKPGGWIKREEE